jgi:hypothetical protein
MPMRVAACVFVSMTVTESELPSATNSRLPRWVPHDGRWMPARHDVSLDDALHHIHSTHRPRFRDTTCIDTHRLGARIAALTRLTLLVVGFGPPRIVT